MMAKKLLIQGGTLVNESGVLQADLLIEGERIKAQGLPNTFPTQEVDEIVDATGKLVLPGLIEPHVHFNSPFMGTTTVHDYDNGTIAAAFGGVTTVIDFSTQPKGGSLLENLRQKEKEASGKAYIDWSIHGILLDASPLTLKEIPELIEAGVPTYKCFTTYKHANRMMDDDGLLSVLNATARYGGMLMVHCENDTIIEHHLRRHIEEGHFDWIYHARSRPPAAENVAIQRVIDLMTEVTAPVYIVHTSTAESVTLIHQARAHGLPIHSETCTHYLALTEEKLLGENGHFYICSPPLRTQRDVDFLWKGLSNECIEVVSTDDAGVPTADRIRLGEGRFDRVPNGMPGVEPRLDILHTEGVYKGRLSLPQLVAVTATNVARLFGLYPQKGHLGPGADADVVIYDPNAHWTMSAKNLHMNTDFCPFEGWQIVGRVQSVLNRGEFVIREGKLVGNPGRGQRVFRKLEVI